MARTSRIKGANFDDLQEDQEMLADRAWNACKPIEHGGLLKYVHGGEYHMYNPDVIATLQAAVNTGDYSLYQDYAKLVNERPVSTLRDLLKLVPKGAPISVDEVGVARQRSSRASTPPACRWARCRPRRTRRWPLP